MQNLPQERISIAVMAAAAHGGRVGADRCSTPRSARHSASRSAASRTAGSCSPNWPPRPPPCGSWSTSSSDCISRRSSLPNRPRWPSGTRTEAQVRLIDRCLQLHGGYGYMREYPVARAYPGLPDPDHLRRNDRDHEGDHRPLAGRLARRSTVPSARIQTRRATVAASRHFGIRSVLSRIDGVVAPARSLNVTD